MKIGIRFDSKQQYKKRPEERNVSFSIKKDRKKETYPSLFIILSAYHETGCYFE